ncbi:MAG: methionyl-tRNA formyltransferase [Aerococcus sp.]|nr:methionyl-tRNA formyltransferase [Aerococcus sp.]
MYKIVYMGTPEFSVKPLKALIASPNYEVKAVVTQPDRPVGRKHKLTPSPVKSVALAHDIQVFQPEKISKDDTVLHFINDEAIDLIITAAFGQFLPERLLEAPQYGAINVHASLLPKYRGGAPVHYAIWNGDDETGITLIKLVKKMDAGDMLAQAGIPIEADDTVETMFEKLSTLGRDVLMANLDAYLQGNITPIPQNEAEVIISPNITREQERINWDESAQRIHNQIRAFNSWPVAYTTIEDVRYKVWASEVVPSATTQAAPGTIIKIAKKPATLQVACGDGTVLALTEIQPAGKKRMAIAGFINGGSGNLEEGKQFDSNEG